MDKHSVWLDICLSLDNQLSSKTLCLSKPKYLHTKNKSFNKKWKSIQIFHIPAQKFNKICTETNIYHFANTTVYISCIFLRIRKMKEDPIIKCDIESVTYSTFCWHVFKSSSLQLFVCITVQLVWICSYSNFLIHLIILFIWCYHQILKKSKNFLFNVILLSSRCRCLHLPDI